MKNNEKNELLETTYLKESVAEYLEEPSDERAFYVVMHLAALAGTGAKALMPLLDLTLLAMDFNPDTEPEDLFEDGPDPEELFMFVESEDGHRWFPLFTDKGELGGVEKTNAVRAVNVRSIIEAAMEYEAFDGIIINPNSDNFALCAFNHTDEHRILQCAIFYRLLINEFFINPTLQKENALAVAPGIPIGSVRVKLRLVQLGIAHSNNDRVFCLTASHHRQAEDKQYANKRFHRDKFSKFEVERVLKAFQNDLSTLLKRLLLRYLRHPPPCACT